MPVGHVGSRASKYHLNTSLSRLPRGGMVSSIVRFVLLGMGHPFRHSLVVLLYIYTGLAIGHRHAVVVDFVSLEALDETLDVALFRPRLRAHQAAHRQRSR